MSRKWYPYYSSLIQPLTYKDTVDLPVQEIIDHDYKETEMRVLAFYAENNNDIFDIPFCSMNVRTRIGPL